jgi:gluconolactonase
MKTLTPLLSLALAMSASASAADFQITNAGEFARCVSANAKVEKLVGDLGFIEGPVWIKSGGYLVFSDIPNDELKKWTPSGGLTTFRKPSQNANGNILDREARLLTAEHTGRRVAIQEKDGAVKTVVDSFEGKKLNSPNDVVVKSDGTIWFTDPEYGLKNDPNAKGRKLGKEQDGNYVYRHDPKTGRTTAVVKDFVQPNGLAFSPDEKKLYIADSGTPKHIRVFDVKADGTIDNSRVLFDATARGKSRRGLPDGLKIDAEGNLFATGPGGVLVFSPDGKHLGTIQTGQATSNCAFGGADGRTLYMTADDYLMRVALKTKGLGF